MARPPTPLGTYGRVSTKQDASGKWTARTRFRDFDGVLRLVEAAGTSISGAENALRCQIRERVTPSGDGQLTRDTKLSELAAFWLRELQVEAAAMSMWLIKSSRKSDRVLRALQLAYRNSQEAIRFAELVKGKGAAAPAREATSRAIERLNQLKDRVGPLRQVELGPPPRYTAILTAVSPQSRDSNRAGYEISSPLVVWKVSSAFLHGSEQVVRALSDIRQMDEFTDGVASFEITPSLQMLAVSIRTCVNLIAQLDERYLYLATHDYAGRPVSG